jgi:hypothetical protein
MPQGDGRVEGSGEADLEPAAAAGRLAGRVVNGLGLRLLRLRPVRRVIRDVVREASAEERPPAPDGQGPASAR